jgi:GH24 family phage-related lysozyme (muramidase)
VKKQPGNMLAARYRQFTTLDLADDDIFELLKTVDADFQQKLRDNFTGYDDYPAPVKRALTDMVYNLGIGGLLKYSHMRKSIADKDWKKAAAECHRNGPSEERNNWTRDLFLEAAK